MIKGIGIDIIELERIKRLVNKQPRFVRRILTEKERAIYSELNNKRKIEFIAGRFAAKEAFAKAAGVGIGKLSFQYIEVLPSDNGAPILTVKGYESANLFVSITHSREYAAAQVIIEQL